MSNKKYQIGFYAPMKPVSHAVASGDRRMARNFVQALKIANYDVHILSDLRTYLGKEGDTNLPHMQELADTELSRLQNFWKEGGGGGGSGGLDVLFCYHLYHKSPDLLLPHLAKDLQVPYIIAEASYAKKLRGSNYDKALSLSAEAILQADLLLQLNAEDYQGLKDLYDEFDQEFSIVPMVPFSDFANVEGQKIISGEGEGKCIFIVHAMMRYGDKYRSYEILAKGFRELLGEDNWRLVIIGGGEAENDIRSLFSEYGERVYFTGVLDDGEIRSWLDFADVYVWGGVNEAYGMGILEAVISGLPVVVGDRVGIRGVVGDGGGIFCPEGDSDIFGVGVRKLYDDYWGAGKILKSMRDYNLARRNLHSVEGAAKFLKAEIDKLVKNTKNGQK